MDTKIQEILNTWHKHFEDEENHYSEFEPSDIDYFVGCMLYNHFAFSKALDTMKTMDLSYDFLSSCGDEYDEIKAKIKSIKFDTDEEKLQFIIDYIDQVRPKYTKPELYLLDRLQTHIDAMAQRYEYNTEAKKVEFTKPVARSANPLLR